MMGNLINVLAVIAGSILGLTFKKLIKDSYKRTIINGLGVTIMTLGMKNALETNEFLLLIVSVVIGSLLGEILDIQGKLDQLANGLGSKLKAGKNSTFEEGFVTATLLFCAGALAILASLESGLTGVNDTFYVKAMLDGVTALIFSSTLGIGVLFAVVPLFVYQTILIFGSTFIQGLIIPATLIEISAVGGVLIIAIALDVLDIKKIKVANMTPAMLIPIIYFVIVG